MIIKHVYAKEKSDALMEHNQLQFIVDINANKREIKEEIEKLFDVEVVKVRTMITPKGEKKATVTLSEKDDVETIARKLGVG
ncbi:MAG: 50S ribosomal protein L23 [Candidatus Syntropharchaeia archaeon]